MPDSTDVQDDTIFGVQIHSFKSVTPPSSFNHTAYFDDGDDDDVCSTGSSVGSEWIRILLSGA